MIQLETLSGQPYDQIYLNETDFKYSDILEHIKRPYPEYNPSKFEIYIMYVKTDIKLFNKGKLINFDDDISFDKEDCVLQIFIKYEYICSDHYKIYNFTEENRYEKIIDLIKKDGYFINLLREEEQNEEICKWAVQENANALQYVKNQTEEICKLAVQQNGYSLKYVKIEQTDELCKLAVQQNGISLRYVKEQTAEICKLAVQQDGFILMHVKNQTDELCKLAVQQYGSALYYVKNQTEELCKLAVQQNGRALSFVKNKTEELCKLAVQQNGDALHYVPESMKHLFM